MKTATTAFANTATVTGAWFVGTGIAISSSFHHVGERDCPLSNLLCPLAIEHFLCRIVPATFLHGGKRVLEAEEATDAEVKAHIREDYLPFLGHLTPPWAFTVKVVQHAEYVVIEQHQRLGLRYPYVLQVAANSNCRDAERVSVDLQHHALVPHQLSFQFLQVHLLILLQN